MTRRRAIAWGAAAVAVVALLLFWRKLNQFPPDTTPAGAYLRIAYNIGGSDPRACFPYLEDRAQHAAYTIRDYRRKAFERIEASYPEPERTRLLDQYRAHAMAEDGADVWVDLAASQGFIARLRRDLSGIGKVEVTGERATVETARGTRYPFRRRDNGIWGLTLFTADLVAEAERAARDWDVVEKAALDYERGR
ncbi:hypothetical protein WME99_33705 [Sorangium sp. So ce136]|uniref:hypothetical protein n=1 Tax=Sorangium sp. So ce136 TaxID=3133284 RepID=UPI003F071A12